MLLLVKGGVDAPVKAGQLRQAGARRQVGVVGEEKDLSPGGGVVPDRGAVHQHLPLIGAVHPCQVPQQGGFTAAVGADKAVDASAADACRKLL